MQEHDIARFSAENHRPADNRKKPMTTAVSPLAVALPELPPLAGVRLSAAAAGIRYQGRHFRAEFELFFGAIDNQKSCC